MNKTLKKIVRTVVVLALVGLFGGSLFMLWNKDRKDPVVFSAKTPFVTTIVKKTVATGAIEPRKEIEIKPQVSGIIEKLYVEPGKHVKAGDLIAQIRIIPNIASLNEAENRVSRAEISLDNARQEFDRNKKLLDEGVIASASLLPLETTLRQAQQEVAAAKDNLEIIRKGASARFGNVANTSVRASVSGTVLEVPVKEGFSVIESNNFNPGTTICTVADMDNLIFNGKIDESEVGRIHTGMELMLSIGALSDQQYRATLEYIAPKGLAENGAIQFEIHAALKLQQGQTLRAGYSANADIVLDRREQVLALPESWLTFSGDSAFVEVETAPQQYRKQHVKLGLSDGINVEVLGGVTANDRIKDPTLVPVPQMRGGPN